MLSRWECHASVYVSSQGLVVVSEGRATVARSGKGDNCTCGGRMQIRAWQTAASAGHRREEWELCETVVLQERVPTCMVGDGRVSSSLPRTRGHCQQVGRAAQRDTKKSSIARWRKAMAAQRNGASTKPELDPCSSSGADDLTPLSPHPRNRREMDGRGHGTACSVLVV